MSQILTLYTTPVIYLLMDRLKRRREGLPIVARGAGRIGSRNPMEPSRSIGVFAVMNAQPKQQPVTESGEKLPDPPPEIAEGAEVPEDEDEQESLEQVRRRYLLGRFWLSAKGFWGRNGSGWPGR